ncbi:MAG: C-GCAxxG-C-C family protein [Candidatus Thorarchaeota archaeon]
MNDTINKALEYFSSNHNCSQSVFRALLEKYGMYFDEGTAAMAGLGGGIGLQGNVCGAVSGAVAALGVLNSRTVSDFEEHKNTTYTSAAKFSYKFKKKFDTIICDELTGIRMADKQERDNAIESGHFNKTCPKFVEEAIRIVLEMDIKA